MSRDTLELIGYAGSALVGVSLMMTSIVRLRVINLLGAACFAVYGILIGAYPVVALNAFLVAVNGYHLARMSRSTEYFHLLEVGSDSNYLRYFLDFYRDEIRQLFPNFRYAPAADEVALFVLRNGVPAGVLVGHCTAPHTMTIDLDYVTPAYRDLRVGRYLFVQQRPFFRSKGIRRLVVAGSDNRFNAYLTSVGFERTSDGSAFAMQIE